MSATILLAEPDPLLGRALVRLLEASGYAVLDLSGPRAAPDVSRVEMVLADERQLHRLPDEVRSRPRVVLAGASKAKETDHEVWLSKPFGSEALLDAVVRLFERAADRASLRGVLTPPPRGARRVS